MINSLQTQLFGGNLHKTFFSEKKNMCGIEVIARFAFLFSDKFASSINFESINLGVV